MDTKHTNSTEADPHGLDQHAPGAKLDAGKVRPWLMISGFSRALQAVAVVTTKGAEKYTPDGWAKVEDGEARYMEAHGRHMLSLGTGEKFDPDTGARHKAQMIWNLLASLELELREDGAVVPVPSPVPSPVPVKEVTREDAAANGINREYPSMWGEPWTQQIYATRKDVV